MRLIDTTTLELQDFSLSEIPPYAILSHTWGDGEVSFHDMSLPGRFLKKGYSKIEQTCSLALKRGIKFAWIDTCCIDKLSSAELTESINSMFQWYSDAVECYAFLEDLPLDKPAEQGLTDCRWFTRGWTLQEMIAPEKLEFYDRLWQCRGTKLTFLDTISSSTKIPRELLMGKEELKSYSIAQRMSWAARRQTTRIEDMSYCLLGIFDVNMPLIYGEGLKAFRRLQEEIMKRDNDLTIFAWDTPNGGKDKFLDIFATSPEAFIDRDNTRPFVGDFAEFSVTNKGLSISGHVPLRTMRTEEDTWHRNLRYLAFLGCCEQESLGVYLRKIGPRLFHRDGRFPLMQLEDKTNDFLIDVPDYFILIDKKPIVSVSYQKFRRSSLHLPANNIFQLRAHAPEVLWDLTDRVFLRPDLYRTTWYPMVIAMVFEGTLAGSTVRLAVLCDYTKEIPDFKVLSPERYPRYMEIIFENDSRHHYTYWREFKLQAPEILRLSNHIVIKVGRQVFRIEISYQKRVVKDISVHSEVVCLQFNVMQQIGRKFVLVEASKTLQQA